MIVSSYPDDWDKSQGTEALDGLEGITNYFWHDDEGVHIASDAGAKQGANTLISNSAFIVRDGERELASFGANVINLGTWESDETMAGSEANINLFGGSAVLKCVIGSTRDHLQIISGDLWLKAQSISLQAAGNRTGLYLNNGAGALREVADFVTSTEDGQRQWASGNSEATVISSTERPTGRSIITESGAEKPTYIRQFRGAITAAVNAVATTTLITGRYVDELVDSGGWWDISNNSNCTMSFGGAAGNGTYTSHMQRRLDTGNLVIETRAGDVDRTGAKYFVWAEYTKI